MKRRTRIYYTPEQKAIIWDRYKQGDSLHDSNLHRKSQGRPLIKLGKLYYGKAEGQD